MSNDSKLADAVQSIIQLDSKQQRQHAIDETCGENRSLRSRLQMIIDALPTEDDAAEDVSVLHTLDRSTKTPRVVLDDSIHESSEPMLQPTSAEMPLVKPESRYQIQGEIARGGIGAILKGRDVDLGRNLAIKVILDKHKDKPKIVQRFIEEAQIGGQLQHPGIAPVYELGQFEDQRPFFTMKLIKGETLAFLLSARRTFADNRATLIGHFEQVCQTVAYAHSRRVIHRDLKPANIMIGDFGEVQVMDWGLAKVISKSGSEKSSDQLEIGDKTTEALSIIQTVRSTGDDVPLGTLQADQVVGSQTQLGHAIGSPAYMPPEQALGQVDFMDQRSDVFGLGAILCEILTGHPPYIGGTVAEVLKLAARAELDDCHQRLEECGADPKLIDTARRCLAPKMVDRPSNAGEVAQRITDHLESVQSQLRETELMRAKEVACAVEARKRWRTTVVLCCVILIIASIGGASWLQLNQRESQRRALVVSDFEDLIQEAKLHQELAENATLAEREPKYAKALFHTQNALAFADSNRIDAQQRATAEELQDEIMAAAAIVRQAINHAESDKRLEDQLDLIRHLHVDGASLPELPGIPDSLTEVTGMRLETILSRAGIDADAPAKEIGKRIRESQIRDTLILTLDFIRQKESSDMKSMPSPQREDQLIRLVKILAAADEDPWRRAVRKALHAHQSGRLHELLENKRLDIQSEFNFIWCAIMLKADGQVDRAQTILAQAQQIKPDHYQLNLAMSDVFADVDPLQAIAFARAALAKRPDSKMAKWNLLTSFATQEEVTTAAAMLKTLLTQDGLNVEDFNSMTLSLLSRQQYQLASMTADAALKIDHDNPEAISLHEFMAGQPEENRADSHNEERRQNN